MSVKAMTFVAQLTGAMDQAAVEAQRRLDKHRRWQLVWTPDFCNSFVRPHRVPWVVISGFDSREEAAASVRGNRRLTVRENPDWCAMPVPA